MNYLREKQILSVSELTHSLKTLLELQYRFVHLQGEISNLRIPSSGHAYFILKDAGAQIRAVLFKGQRKYLREDLQEGRKVVCHGRISLYEARGEYQIIVDTVDTAGSGELFRKFEQLKNRLAAEGLFDQNAKQKIPEFPQKIAAITSPTGAAVHDFLKICKARRFYGEIIIIPTVVQGKTAPDEIAHALSLASSLKEVDLVALLRGGGSIEDLWCFNEEKTVRAITSTPIPVITGVGHETDTTLADLAADFRAHTPTAAAEAVIPDAISLLLAIDENRNAITRILQQKIAGYQKDVRHCTRIIGNMDHDILSNRLKIDTLLARAGGAVLQKTHEDERVLNTLQAKLQKNSPITRLALQQEKMVFLQQRLTKAMQNSHSGKQHALQQQLALLDSVGPLATLRRGYAIATDSHRKIISSSDQVEAGERLNLTLARGEINCRVEEKR